MSHPPVGCPPGSQRHLATSSVSMTSAHAAPGNPGIRDRVFRVLESQRLPAPSDPTAHSQSPNLSNAGKVCMPVPICGE